MLAGVFSWLTILRPGTAGLLSSILDTMGPGAGFVIATLFWVSCWIGTVAVALAATGYLSIFLPVVSKPPGTTIVIIARRRKAPHAATSQVGTFTFPFSKSRKFPQNGKLRL